MGVEARGRKGRGGVLKQGGNPARGKYTFHRLFSYFVVEIRVIPLEFDMKPSRKKVKL